MVNSQIALWWLKNTKQFFSAVPKREVAEGEKDEEINILQLEGVVASQKDIAHGGIPERAIDGNTNGQWGSGLVQKN